MSAHPIGHDRPDRFALSNPRAAEPMDFIVMEYIAGQSLDCIMADGALPVERALDYAAQAAAGLAAAHGAGEIADHDDRRTLRLHPAARSVADPVVPSLGGT